MFNLIRLKLKGITSHGRHPDQALFCPLDGKRLARLMTTNRNPLLLISSACQPVIKLIIELLQLTEIFWHSHCAVCTLTVHQSLVESILEKVTRPEIIPLRFPMQYSSGSSETTQ
ncbi:uncharacterized protein VP01_2288g2 [Puccinia sorghi]|uniref:Uncharacterized protein n=1 Tax=Puccinia sorghi TaxID=27349 RepID=A0A0L6V7Z2_9BASI|nr:uncharacterized protein VP01_2288g2 [Puccinia sorghi]